MNGREFLQKKVVKPPKGDVGTGAGYRGKGGYDAYGNPLPKGGGGIIEMKREGNLRLPHLLGGKK